MLLAFAPQYFWGTSCFILSTLLGGGCQVITHRQTGHQLLPDGRLMDLSHWRPLGLRVSETQNGFFYELKYDIKPIEGCLCISESGS